MACIHSHEQTKKKDTHFLLLLSRDMYLIFFVFPLVIVNNGIIVRREKKLWSNGNNYFL